MLWISYFPTKKVLHDKNRTFSKRDFSAAGFLDLSQTSKTQLQNHCSCISLIFTRKAMHLMVRFPNSWFNFLSRKKSIIAMFISCLKKSEKKCLLREVYSAMSHVILIAETRVYIYATKTWNLWGFFTVFLKVFAEKYIKFIYIPQEMKNGLSLRQ